MIPQIIGMIEPSEQPRYDAQNVWEIFSSAGM